jgi:hypothetical protein
MFHTLARPATRKADIAAFSLCFRWGKRHEMQFPPPVLPIKVKQARSPRFAGNIQSDG